MGCLTHSETHGPYRSSELFFRKRDVSRHENLDPPRRRLRVRPVARSACRFVDANRHPTFVTFFSGDPFVKA